MRGRAYQFSSVWRIRAPLESCWTFLTSPGQRWLDWWPRLRSIDVDRADGLVGSEARCVWRSPLGYRLRTDLRLVDVISEKRVELAVTGDVVGSAVVEFSPTADGTRVDVSWQVTTTPRWMNVAAPLLRPAFTWGHRVVMRAGERGLNAVLTGGPPPT